jgi:hypothetical protein
MGKTAVVFRRLAELGQKTKLLASNILAGPEGCPPDHGRKPSNGASSESALASPSLAFVPQIAAPSMEHSGEQNINYTGKKSALQTNMVVRVYGNEYCFQILPLACGHYGPSYTLFYT